MEIIEKKKYNQEFGRLAKLDTITKGDLSYETGQQKISRKKHRNNKTPKPPTKQNIKTMGHRERIKQTLTKFQERRDTGGIQTG